MLISHFNCQHYNKRSSDKGKRSEFKFVLCEQRRRTNLVWQPSLPLESPLAFCESRGCVRQKSQTRSRWSRHTKPDEPRLILKDRTKVFNFFLEDENGKLTKEMTGSRQNSSELRLEVVFMRARRTEPRPKKKLGSSS
jgi:hypothetical protein